MREEKNTKKKIIKNNNKQKMKKNKCIKKHSRGFVTYGWSARNGENRFIINEACMKVEIERFDVDGMIIEQGKYHG